MPRNSFQERDESIYKRQGTSRRTGPDGTVGYRLRTHDGRPACGPPLARGARPQGERHGRRERLREPHAIQRQERPAALPPHPGGRPAPAGRGRRGFRADAFGRRDISRGRHPDFRFRADRQGDGGCDAPRTLQRRGAGRQPPVRHRAPGTRLLRGEGFPADRRDQGDDGPVETAGGDRRMPHRPRRGRTGALVAQHAARRGAPRRSAAHLRHAARSRGEIARNDARRTEGMGHGRSGAQPAAQGHLLPVGRRADDAGGRRMERLGAYPGLHRRTGRGDPFN